MVRARVRAYGVIAVESVWLERIRTTALYRYRLPDQPFISLRDHGVHISRETVTPEAVEPMRDLLQRLVEADVELRLCPSLVPLGRAIIQTTLHYSLIRMRHVQGWTPPANDSPPEAAGRRARNEPSPSPASVARAR